MGMGNEPRTLAIEFNATSPAAKRFAQMVYDLAIEELGDDDWYITATFSPPEGWDRFRPAPTVDVQR
jgi:hypothetical protein